MTHETAREKLLDLAYGELTGREGRRVEAHLHECEACRAELAAIRETRGLMSALGEAPAPARGEAELLAAARAAAEGRRRPGLLSLPPWFLGASATAVALFVVGAVSYRLLAAAPERREDPEALLGRDPVTAVERAPEVAEERDAAVVAQRAPEPETKREPEAVTDRAGAERGRAAQAARAPETAAKRRPGALVEEGSDAAEDRAAEPTARKQADRAAPPAPRAEVTSPERPHAPVLQSPTEEPAAPESGFAAPPSQGPARAEESPRPTSERARAAEAPAPRAAAPMPAAPAAEGGSAPGANRSSAPRAALAPRAPGESDPVARWQALRGAGRLRGEVVTFLDCPGEAWRKVETDAQGQVVRYVRHGLAGGVPFEAELFYAEDGALGAARYREAHGAWRELRLPGASAGAAIPAPALDPGHASEAAADAPPRCRF